MGLFDAIQEQLDYLYKFKYRDLFGYDKVINGGLPGSGSTYTYQVIKEMGFKVKKVHHYVKRPMVKIITYRDPRDMIASAANRIFKEMQEQEGLKEVLYKSYDLLFDEVKVEEVYRNYKNDRCAYLFRYEDYFNGNERQIIKEIAAILKKKLSDAEIDAIMEKFSIEANKKIADRIKKNEEYDPETMIHGNHISSGGKVGTWQELFDDEYKDFLKEKIGPLLIDMGYEQDNNW